MSFRIKRELETVSNKQVSDIVKIEIGKINLMTSLNALRISVVILMMTTGCKNNKSIFN